MHIWLCACCFFCVCKPLAVALVDSFILSEFSDSANILLSFFIVASSAFVRIDSHICLLFFLLRFFLCSGKLVSLIKSTNKNAFAWAEFWWNNNISRVKISGMVKSIPGSLSLLIYRFNTGQRVIFLLYIWIVCCSLCLFFLYQQLLDCLLQTKSPSKWNNIHILQTRNKNTQSDSQFSKMFLFIEFSSTFISLLPADFVCLFVYKRKKKWNRDSVTQTHFQTYV